MDEFAASEWSRPEYSAAYRDEVDAYLPERPTLLNIAASFFVHFVDGQAAPARVLDLGCGDGAVTEALCAVRQDLAVVAADGSADMLRAARKRLVGLPVVEFSQVTFEEVIAGEWQRLPFDFIISAFAIHHLERETRTALLRRLLDLLRPGAYFLNVDVMLPAETPYTEWYFTLWQEWIARHRARMDLDQNFDHIPDQARREPDNHFDTLQSQLASLMEAGFAQAACHYRYGMFGIYSGQRPA